MARESPYILVWGLLRNWVELDVSDGDLLPSDWSYQPGCRHLISCIDCAGTGLSDGELCARCDGYGRTVDRAEARARARHRMILSREQTVTELAYDQYKIPNRLCATIIKQIEKHELKDDRDPNFMERMEAAQASEELREGRAERRRAIKDDDICGELRGTNLEFAEEDDETAQRDEK